MAVFQSRHPVLWLTPLLALLVVALIANAVLFVRNGDNLLSGLLKTTNASNGTHPSGSFVLDNGSACTTFPTITASVTAQNATEFILSDNAFYVDGVQDLEGSWESLTRSPQTKLWTLPSEDDHHIVYMRLRNGDGVLSEVYEQTIELDLDGYCNQPQPEEPAPQIPEQGVSPVSGEAEVITPVLAGDYIRAENLSTVYYVDSGLVRHPFFNTTIFCTWQDNFAEVKTVTDATLATLPLGSVMLPQPGSVLVKIESSPATYALEQDTDSSLGVALRELTSEELARSLFGVQWADYVIDIPPTLFTRFGMGSEIATPGDFSGDVTLLKKREFLCKE